MKKIRFVLIISMMMISVCISSCKKAEEIGIDKCNSLYKKINDASEVFDADLSNANCNAYTSALQAYIDGCSSTTASDKKELQDIINSLRSICK